MKFSTFIPHEKTGKKSKSSFRNLYWFLSY